MDKFVARSGREVKAGREDGSLVFGKLDGYLGRDAVFDAEEYFQAKRDEELGRWRWPLNPHYVVYPSEQFAAGEAGGWVRVVHEATSFVEEFARHATARATRADMLFPAAARAYFEAHPEVTPWDDAKVGEIWAVTAFGHERPCRVIEANLSTEREGGIAFLPIDELGAKFFRPSQSITAAHRVWPEAERTVAEGVSSQAGMASFRGGL